MVYLSSKRQTAIKLRRSGFSLNEIAAKLNIAKSTGSLWLKNVHLSTKAKQILEKKRRDNFFRPGNIWWSKAKKAAMATHWTSTKLARLEKLYRSGLSMREVGEKMGVSLWSINSAMKRRGISRRAAAATKQFQFDRSPLSFTPKINLTTKEKLLKTAGLMLYWAEGGKRTHDKVDFANSDPLMISLFVKFLRKIYRVDETRLRCLIFYYPSHNIDELTSFWSDLVKIPKKQFTKPFIRNDGGNFHSRLKYGVLHVSYSDSRLLNLMLKEIQALGYNL